MGAGKRRVLYVCHNHPSISPGGAETYALELYTAMRGSRAFEPVLLARTGPPHLPNAAVHPGTALRAVNGDPNQYLFHTDIADFNWPLLTNRRKQPYLERFRECLETIRPDLPRGRRYSFQAVALDVHVNVGGGGGGGCPPRPRPPLPPPAGGVA